MRHPRQPWTAAGWALWMAACPSASHAPPDPAGASDTSAETIPETTADSGPQSDIPPAGASCPAGTATLTFSVDDGANQTYLDGELLWTGSFAWEEATNHLAYATSWLPEEGPYPPLYDDGPRSAGGHEPEGAAAGDHLFGVSVCYQADATRSFAYGVLNEDLRWIWLGKNGVFDLAAGEVGTVAVPGMTLPAFGDRDLRLTVDLGALQADFAGLDASYKIFVKGTMNSWTPVQLLDDGAAPDATAGDGVFTYQQSLFLGPHDGLLSAQSEVQFVFVFAKGDTEPDDGLEYKVDGDARPEGVAAEAWCASRWTPQAVALAQDAKGKAMNTAVVVCEGAPPDPECSDAKPCEKVGEICEAGKCVPGAPCTPEILALDPATGGTLGGTPVKLYGTCLGNNTLVRFDATAATGAAWDAAAAHLSVLTPPHPKGVVDVSVENPPGQKTTFQAGFTYVETGPAPILTLVTPASGPPAGGLGVTLTGQFFQAGATAWFGSSLCDVPTVASDGTWLACTAPPGVPGPVAVKVKNPDGQEATLAQGFTYTAGLPQWARLEPPENLVVEAGAASKPLSAQVYKEGSTPGAGPGSGIVAEIGYGPAGSDPSSDPGWAWSPATYKADEGNNDVYEGTLQIEAPGTYSATFRFGPGDGGFLVADLDGTDNGLDAAQLALVVVSPPGLVGIDQLTPSVVSVVGGETIQLSGKGLSPACSVLVGDVPALEWQAPSAQAGAFAAPSRPPGAEIVTLTCPDGGASSLLEYVGTWDGVLTEWLPGHQIAAASVPTDWGAGANELSALYAASDGESLYLAVAGHAKGGEFGPNALLVYLDTDLGAGTGLTATAALEDTGAVDAALGGALTFQIEGFGAEIGLATLDMASYDPALDGGDPGSKAAGWRGLSPATDLPWLLGGGVFASASGVEATIALSALYPGGPTGAARTIGMVVRIANQDGSALSNQALPPGTGGAANATATAASTFSLVY